MEVLKIEDENILLKELVEAQKVLIKCLEEDIDTFRVTIELQKNAISILQMKLETYTGDL